VLFGRRGRDQPRRLHGHGHREFAITNSGKLPAVSVRTGIGLTLVTLWCWS